MRPIISGLAAAALLTGFAASADVSAYEGRKYRKYDKDYYEDRYERDWRAFRRLVPGYQARNPDNFRQGSKDWWRAMDLEGRGGHPRL